MMGLEEEVAALRADVERLRAAALTKEQRDTLVRIVEHVDRIIEMAESDRMRRWLLNTVRSWSVAIAAVVAAIWVVRDGAARIIRAIIAP